MLATIGLFLAFGYWNDWFQSSLFITDNNLLSLQALLNSMQKNIEYIAQHPDPGISLADYKRAMPSERHSYGNRCCGRRPHCLHLPLLPEVLHFWPDGWCSQGLRLYSQRQAQCAPASGINITPNRR